MWVIWLIPGRRPCLDRWPQFYCPNRRIKKRRLSLYLRYKLWYGSQGFNLGGMDNMVSHVTGYPARSRDRSCDRHTVTATRPPPHGYCHTATATRSPLHGHRHTATATRSPQHSPATLGRVTCQVMCRVTCRVMWWVMCQVVSAPLTMGTYQGPWPSGTHGHSFPLAHGHSFLVANTLC